MEDRPGAGAKGLGVVRVDRLSGDDNGGDPGGIGGADDGAHVPRILEVVEHEDESGLGNRINGAVIESYGGQYRLRRLGVSDLFNDAGRQSENADAVVL